MSWSNFLNLCIKSGIRLGNELKNCKLWSSPCTHTDSGHESFCQMTNLKRKEQFWETVKTNIKKANKPQSCKNLPWMTWNEHLYIARIKLTLERIFVSKPEHPSESPVNSDYEQSFTILWAAAKHPWHLQLCQRQLCLLPLQSKGGRLGGCLSEAGTAIPCPPGNSGSSKLTLHSSPLLSPFHVHSASNFTFCQEANVFALSLSFWASLLRSLELALQRPNETPRKSISLRFVSALA